VKERAGFAAKPTLTGEKVVLRPFNDRDLPAIRAVLLDPEARILTGSVHDEAQARAPLSPDEDKPLLDWYGTRNVTSQFREGGEGKTEPVNIELN